MESVRNVGSLLGRILLALIYVLGGATKLMNLAGTVGFMQAMGMHRLVYPQALGASLLELIGGLLLMAGFKARPVALIMFLYMIPVTIIFHALPGGQMNQVHMMKNLSIMGALLFIASNGPGAMSIDGREG